MKPWLKHIFFQRHLLWEFLRRDLQARYVGSAMGFFWSVINPMILLAVYTFVFAFVMRARMESMGRVIERSDFAFYIFCGLLPWYAFQESLIRATTCIVDNGHLIKQIRFPAKIMPVYLSLSSIVNQLIGTALFLVVLLVWNQHLPVMIVALPVVIIMQFFFFTGMGLLFATMNAYFRDIGPLVSILTLILMWTTPMFYTLEHAKEYANYLYLNPLTYLVLLHQHLIFYGIWPPAHLWLVFGGLSVVAWVIGYVSFTRCHKDFADLL